MSLLMDALNKAEQAKRQVQADAEAGKATAPPLTLELTPLPTPEAPPGFPAIAEVPPSLPELPSHLGVLDEEFIAHAAEPKPAAKEKKPPRPAPVEAVAATRPESMAAANAPSNANSSTVPGAANPPARIAEAREREAAQNLFDAKQAGKPASRRGLAIAIGVLTLLAGVAIGGYFWFQLQPSSGLSTLRPQANAPRPPVQPPPPPVAAAAAPAAAAAAIAAPAAVAPTRPVGAEPPLNADSETSKPIRLSASRISLNPALARGYDAYMAGRFGDARNDYLQVLKSEPSNIDALHGMAAISLRQGQSGAAEEYYLRAIEADPRDALAHAGLIGLKGQIDPLQAESRLKTLLAAQPEMPYLNFALGNLYASQDRWNEAQAAYFKAYSGEPQDPDTLFNLAISLDRLHQSKLARHYYSLALAAAENHPFSFDKTQLDTRLRELQ